MEKILKDYISICEKFKSIDLADGKFKTEKHKMLREWNNAKYKNSAHANEIIDFYSKDKENFFNRFFYTKVINPCITKEIETGDVDLLKFLFEILCEKEDGFVIYNMLDCFCDCNKNFKVVDLADIILEKDPNFKCALKYKFVNISSFLEYSVQNLPEDLFYSSEITFDVLHILFSQLDQYEKLGKKLGVDVRESAKRYNDIYETYKIFLKDKDVYESFEKCLKVNGIKI